MTTQVRPLAGGAWNNVNVTAGKVSRKDTTFGATLGPAQLAPALRACNEWLNCAGVGTASVRAQKTARAVGVQLQEV